MKNNKIYETENHAFSGLFQLKNLYLDNNNISIIKSQFWNDLHSLIYLSLVGNKITQLYQGVIGSFFLHKKGSMIVDFERNKLKTLSWNTYVNRNETIIPVITPHHHYVLV